MDYWLKFLALALIAFEVEFNYKRPLCVGQQTKHSNYERLQFQSQSNQNHTLSHYRHQHHDSHARFDRYRQQLQRLQHLQFHQHHKKHQRQQHQHLHLSSETYNYDDEKYYRNLQHKHSLLLKLKKESNNLKHLFRQLIHQQYGSHLSKSPQQVVSISSTQYNIQKPSLSSSSSSSSSSPSSSLLLPTWKVTPHLWQHLQSTISKKNLHLLLDNDNHSKRDDGHHDEDHDENNSSNDGIKERKVDVESDADINADADIDADKNAVSDHLNNHSSAEMNESEIISETWRCPKCESNQKMNDMNAEELTQLRIELVKQQILEKLRLKERPRLTAVSLPKPISEAVNIDVDIDTDTIDKDFDDYYARTNRKFIFLQVENDECHKLFRQPSLCFTFKIDSDDIDNYDVNNATLWLFKNYLFTDEYKSNGTHASEGMIVLSEVQKTYNRKYLTTIQTTYLQSIHVEDGWLKFLIEAPVKRWLKLNNGQKRLLQLSCKACSSNYLTKFISSDAAYRPFIMINTRSKRGQQRRKRSINCSRDVTECCREKLYISFDEIGWGDWIIRPRGYDAYFCRGSCSSVASVAMAMSQHSSTLQKFNHLQNYKKNLELVPCCTAKQYSPLELIVVYSNNTAIQKTFPNMVVESCGCR